MKRKKSSGGGANWMDTYGDMVTLLLCFFVLLYSMSTISEENWKAIVMSFNPDAALEQREIEGGNEGPISDPDSELGIDQEMVDEDMEALFQALQQAVAEQQQSSQNKGGQQISISKGNGYVFISFDDTIFFDGDSYVLRSESTPILDAVSALLTQYGRSVDEVRVLGHTAQARGDRPNNPTTDRFLASNRATVVLVYLQEHSEVDPARLVSVGYGQWRPIAENDVPETRLHNRRVEMIIAGKQLDSSMGDSIEQYYHQRENSSSFTNP